MTVLRKNVDQEQPLEIALAFPVGIPHLDRVARGIRDFAASLSDTAGWQFTISPETHHLPPSALEGWQGDGVIALTNSQQDAEVLRRLECPVVEISGALESPHFPRVRPDYQKIGKMAARHLLQCGVRRFAFYGVEKVWYSRSYESGFCSEIESRSLEVARLFAPNTLEGLTRWDTGQSELETWLETLTPPFAVMAAHDPRAAMVIRACDRLGLRVPDDVMVVGVNDDTGTCESCRPMLTSIERNGRAIGLAAAKMLERLIRERNYIPPGETVIEPGQVIVRGSSGVVRAEEPVVADAVRFLEENFRNPEIGVRQVVEVSGRSRRWLESAFRHYLDRTPGRFLAEMRGSAAKELMASHPGLSRTEIAAACGFASARQMKANLDRYDRRTQEANSRS